MCRYRVLRVVDNNGTPANPADDFNPAFTGGDTNANGLLDLSETWAFIAARIVTPGQYTNLATTLGTPPPPARATTTLLAGSAMIRCLRGPAATTSRVMRATTSSCSMRSSRPAASSTSPP